jgi:hypothetical protein
MPNKERLQAGTEGGLVVTDAEDDRSEYAEPDDRDFR